MEDTWIVTGGCGFIGSHLTRALVGKGYQVKVIDNLSSSSIDGIEELIDSGDVAFFKEDIRDQDSLESIIDGREIGLYHLAADPSVRESVEKPIESFEQNVRGSMNLLEIMRQKGIKEMVFASSGGTLYGDVETFPTKETTPLRPISPYGASKAAVEMYLSAYASSYHLDIVSLRFANIYGPGSNHGVMYDFYNKLMEDPNKLTILGDGKQAKGYLYIEDCVKAILLVGTWISAPGNTGFHCFNLGTESWTTVTELAETMVDILDLQSVEFTYTGGERGWTGDVSKNLLDITRIKELGWRPETGIREGMSLFVHSLMEKS